ncbi:MAG: hypothetical protein CM1200mP11_3320 [Nitrosopumilaceae archaeon]|nr:MAG: hypothetical protein CM1200mP11_3320 [Nitrosopumilaceae archaeon]
MIDSGAKATKEEIETLTKKYTKTFSPRLAKLVSDALNKSGLSKLELKQYVKKVFHFMIKHVLNLDKQ